MSKLSSLNISWGRAFLLSSHSWIFSSTLLDVYASCPLWNPLRIGDIQQIEGVQRTFTSKIKGCENLDYHKRLKHLGLFSLQRRRERYIIIHVWKILNGLTQNDLGVSLVNDSKRLGIKQNMHPPYQRTARTQLKRSMTHHLQWMVLDSGMPSPRA